MRKCTRCNKIKDLVKFSLKTSGKLGKNSHCKGCISEYDLSRRSSKKGYDRSRYLVFKGKIKSKTKKYYINNKQKYSNYWTERKRLTNNKLSSKYRKEIEIVYKSRDVLNSFGGDFVVDHIIPIKNKHVCGLHVHWNLQVISSSDNSKKSNMFDFTNNNISWKNKA